MIYRKLGKTGVDISEISLGAEHLEKEDRDTIKDVVSTAVDNGVNLIDLVGMVAPEARDNMGAALRGIREKVMLSAHFGATYQNGEYHKTRDTSLCEASFHDLLSRLRTDYIDILMFHWVDNEDDYRQAFNRKGYLGLALRLKQEGKARFFALSTHRTSIAKGIYGVRSCNITKLVNVALSNMSANVDMLYLKRYSRVYWRALYILQ